MDTGGMQMGLQQAARRIRTGVATRAIARLVLMLVAAVTLLAGCTEVRFGSTFTEDGTATHTLEVTVPRASMTEQDVARVERQIADAETRARLAGLTTARIDNPESVGLRVINTTSDATDAGLALNSIFNTLVVNETSGPVAPFQGTFSQVSEAVGGNSFKLELTVNGDLLYDAAANVAPGHPQMTTPEGVREVVRIEYRVTMPGEITNTNGGRRGEGSAVWTIPLEGPTQLEVTSTVGKDTPWIWTILTIIGALLIVAVTAGLVWTILMRRRRAGRMRIAGAAGGATEPGAGVPPGLNTLPEVRASLGQLIRRVLHGEPISIRHDRSHRPPVRLEDSGRGADAERN
jgi:hypothetical protein